MGFKVVMVYPGGEREEEDEVFDTEEEANDFGLVQLENYSAGGEVLNLSNPGDYPLSEEEADFEIVEVDD